MIQTPLPTPSCAHVRTDRPRLHIHVGDATHFLRWELPVFARYFELANAPDADTILLAYGPDVVWTAARLPAKSRMAYLFPGFGYNPYHNLRMRSEATAALSTEYQAVFVNPGPLQVAYSELPHLYVCPFSVDTSLVRLKQVRTSLDSLIHISSRAPQKDYRRSQRVMQLTSLHHEVFPTEELIQERAAVCIAEHNTAFEGAGYLPHEQIVEKYHASDGFVHIASEIVDPQFLDGKYTATLLEAGVTGAILFWHDTFNLGNDFETIFALPSDPEAAARMILEIRQRLDVADRSRRTHEEIVDRCNPDSAVGMRCRLMFEV
jgi:hypothetical protein